MTFWKRPTIQTENRLVVVKGVGDVMGKGVTTKIQKNFRVGGG